ncbi:MAG: hypothetical protein PVH64_10015, partial [Bacillota bacterium]
KRVIDMLAQHDERKIQGNLSSTDIAVQAYHEQLRAMTKEVGITIQNAKHVINKTAFIKK